MNGSRDPAPVEPPVTLTIAGSDSGGGAGIQADLKTMEAVGAFGTSVVTSVTAQNSLSVESIHPVPVEEIEAQIEAVGSDFHIQAAKTGMLGTASVIELVATHAAQTDTAFVVDPVMVAASGDRLLPPDAADTYVELIAEATVVTPNADEAEILTGIEIDDEASMQRAGEQLLDIGATAALVKGGHVGTDGVTDVFVTEDGTQTFEHPRVETAATHGSGCTLSSSIAARIAHGEELSTAVATSIEFMGRAIRYHLDVGEGPGAVHHLAGLRERAARHPTQEAVESVVDRLVEADARAIVPEVGMNVVGATPFAESASETAAVEGRITRIESGIRPNRGTRFGASSHVARFLLSAREHDAGLRFAANLRFDEEIEAALANLDAPVVEIDRSNEPTPDVEGSTMDWVAQQAFGDAAGAKAAVFDRGDVGKEAMTRVVAPDARTLSDRVRTILDALQA
ncbi:MAG: bifunctional hydroxymethylpyrimidine kinase/phosphomethylpyrimidine kinase [Halolamina sp.]|uniref:bifunctional hydroxymethylpyrimidine kinase/phosphomethylpyrimidine kinase n=1 Tax=Halolamina sp. TaxID=1940283 RepID=UPI002FC2A5AE